MKIKKILITLLIFILAGVFLFSAYKVVSALYGYSHANSVYSDLADSFVSVNTPDETDAASDTAADSATDTEPPASAVTPPISVDFDALLEYNPDVYELLDLNLGKCRMAVAAPVDFRDDGQKTLKVATKFCNIAANYYAGLGREIDIIKLNGSIEIAPILGLSDVIVDIVETGTTLKENNLEVKSEIVPISARLIANKSSFKFKGEDIEKIVNSIKNQVNRND